MLNELIEEYRELESRLLFQELSHETLINTKIPEDSLCVVVRCRYKGIPSEVRIVRDRNGDRTLNVDRQFRVMHITQRMREIQEEIGKIVLSLNLV